MGRPLPNLPQNPPLRRSNIEYVRSLYSILVQELEAVEVTPFDHNIYNTEEKVRELYEQLIQQIESTNERLGELTRNYPDVINSEYIRKIKSYFTQRTLAIEELHEPIVIEEYLGT